VADAIRGNVEKGMADKGYFVSSAVKGRVAGGWGLSLLAIMVFITVAWFKLGVPAIAGSIIGFLVSIPFWVALDARTAKGVAAKEHALGLKLYLEVAEKQRLEKLQGPNAAYARGAGEPVKTVELFEKLLPYAMVLGVEKQWAEQFKDLYTSPPDWYSGNWSTFNSIYLVSSLNSGIGSAVNTSFAAPSSSGGSGFGGGGFSPAHAPERPTRSIDASVVAECRNRAREMFMAFSAYRVSCIPDSWQTQRQLCRVTRSVHGVHVACTCRLTPDQGLRWICTVGDCVDAG